MPRPASPLVWYESDDELAANLVARLEKLWATDPQQAWHHRRSPIVQIATSAIVVVGAGYFLPFWAALATIVAVGIGVYYGPATLRNVRITRLENQIRTGTTLIEHDAGWMVLAHELNVRGHDLRQFIMHRDPAADRHIGEYIKNTEQQRGAQDRNIPYEGDDKALSELRARAVIAAQGISTELGGSLF